MEAGIPKHKLSRPENYKAFSEQDFYDYLINNCLKEMYAFAQPAADYTELNLLAREGKEDKNAPFYMQHYLSDQELGCIIEKYLDIFRMKCMWNDYCDTMIDYLANGGYKDKYVEKNDDTPGFRSYEDVPAIATIIGQENADKVIEHMNLCKNFYKLNLDESRFKFTVLNIAPSTHKESVIDFWKKEGVDIEIEDRSESDIFALHYENVMPEELPEYREELEYLMKEDGKE